MSCSLSDEKTGESFYFSSFSWVQGRILRGAIKYIAALDENSVLDKKALLDAGVPLPDSSISDAAAVEKFRPAISEALALLNSWVREPAESDEIESKIFNGTGFSGPSLLASQYPLSELMNLPFFVEKVKEEDSVCPPSLLKLGLEGVFVCMERSEDELEPECAQVLVDMLDRLEPFTDWEGWEHDDDDEDDEDDNDSEDEGSEVPAGKVEKPERTAGQQMRAVLAAWAADSESSIVQ